MKHNKSMGFLSNFQYQAPLLKTF